MMDHHETDLEELEAKPTADHGLRSSESFESIDSRTTEERSEDEFFDKLEDLMATFMIDANHHHLHCRFLRWSMPGDPTRVMDAVVVIHPPTTKN
jgi:hypothetical protein